MEANRREKHKGRRKPVKMKTFRTQLRNIRSFREDRIDNQALIDNIKQKNNVITKDNAKVEIMKLDNLNLISIDEYNIDEVI